MGWWEDWGETVLNVMTGGIYGAAKEGSREAANLAQQMNSQAAQQGQVGVAIPGARIPAFPGARPPAPSAPGQPSGAACECCCDRFQLENGLLLDKSTGRVWEHDPAAKAFVFLPMKPAAEHEKLAGILLERDLAKIQSEYADEVLGTLPQAARAAQAAEFEKKYIQPLRATLGGKGPS